MLANFMSLERHISLESNETNDERNRPQTENIWAFEWARVKKKKIENDSCSIDREDPDWSN